MKKLISLLLVAVLLSAMFVVPVSADDDFFWAEGEYDLVKDNNVDPHHAWGYEFTIDTINSISGNTTAVFTTAEAYASAGKWSSKAVFAPTSEANVYELVAAYQYTNKKGDGDIADGIVDFSKGQIVLVAQESGTRPEKNEVGTLRFPNWEERAAIWGLVHTPGAKATLAGIDVAAGTMTNGTVTIEAEPKADDENDEDGITESYNLIEQSTPWSLTGDGYYEYNGDALTMHANSQWPCIQAYYYNHIPVSIEKTYLDYEFEVTGASNINFIFASGGTFSISNTALNLSEGQYDTGSGDIHDGYYKGRVYLSDLITATQYYADIPFPEQEIYNGFISFAGLNIFSVGENVETTVYKLELVTETEVINPDIPSVPVVPSVNVAAGKTYTVSQMFRQGGAEAGWGWDENAPVAYPDEDGITMTDGVIAATDATYYDAVWAGWNHTAPEYYELGYSFITVDLGEATDIAEAVIYLGSSGLISGIGCNNMVVEILVSDDGEEFVSVGSAFPEDDANSSCVRTSVKLESVANAQYVQFRMVRAGWMFVSEVEVYSVVSSEGGDTDEPIAPNDFENSLKEALGTAFDDAKVDYVIEAPSYYKAGDEITVKVYVRNITAENGIHLAEFKLYYDNTKLLITNDIDEEDDNILVCVEKAPSAWGENFSRVSNDYNEDNEEGTEVKPLNDGVIIASIFTDKTTASSAVKEDDQVVFAFTFKVLEDSVSDLGFVIPHAETEAALNTKTGVEQYTANGDYAITHRVTVLEGYAPTCIEDGLTDGLYCPDCDMIIVEQEPIPALGHDDGEWATVLEPDVGAAGWEECRCTVCGELLDGKEIPALRLFGDINDNGEIDKYDYLMVKRAVMGTLILGEIEAKAADVNKNGAPDKYDYLLIKRHVMGTYTINSPQEAPEFTNQFITLGVVGVTDRITDADAIPLTGVNVAPSYGAIILYTTEYGKNTPSGLSDFVVAKFEYDHSQFYYVLAENYGKGASQTAIPEDGFVLAVHSSQAMYISRLNAISEGEKAFPHGVHIYTGNDFTANRSDSAPVIDGKVDAGEYGEAIGEVNPDNVGWSYEHFEPNFYFASAKYYSTYDDEYLYLAIVVDSPYHYCPLNSNNAGSMWEYCSVLVNISSYTPDSDYIAEHFDHISDTTAVNDAVIAQCGFAVNHDGESLSAGFIGKKNSNIISKVVRDDENQTTTYEIAIPLADYGIKAESGTELGLSFAMYMGIEWEWRTLFARNGGGIINNNDWSKMFKVTLA